MYHFGESSRLKLAAVHPNLIKVASLAIQRTTQDFTIENGIRDKKTQLMVWKAGNSKLNGISEGTVENGIVGTGVGNHQVKADGFGYAIDATPWVNGKILWANRELSDKEQWDYIFPVAWAFQQAAFDLNIHVRWGGIWDRILNDIPLISAVNLALEVSLYVERHKGPDLLDGPHFELRK